MTSLSVSILGPFSVRRGSDNLSSGFRTRKERALLAYLAVEKQRRHRREALAELLWPDRPEGYARTNLRQALFGLRRAIGDTDIDCLHITDDYIQFRGAQNAELDADSFEYHIQTVVNHKHKSLESCSVCAGHLQAAEMLYRGDLLEDVSLNDSHAFQEWVTFRREQYFRDLLMALRVLSDYFQRQGDFERAHKYAWRYVNLAPLEEAAHRLYMNILALNGERSAALEQFQECRKILMEELGVEPSAETVALYERIKTGMVLDLGTPIIDLQLSNLPAQLTPFTGRQEHLARLVECLENPECRLITLVGMAGVGKTRLAVQAAVDGLVLFSDGTWFVPLETVTGAEGLALAITQSIGLPIGAEKDPYVEMLRLLRPLETLLILDGFEHLREQTGVLVDILRQAPRVKLIVTSRARLNHRAACLFELEGLAYPREADLEQALSSPAVQLLMNRAQHSRAGFNLTATNLASILRLVELVDGLPLALELAASRLREYTSDQIVLELELGLDILKTRLLDVPARQRSMAAALKPSWNRLGSAERTALRKLVTLEGNFSQADIDAAQIHSETMDELVSCYLVCNPHPDSYSLHPLVRTFVSSIPETGPLPALPDTACPELAANRLTAYDPLTNLPGWDLFWDRLNHLLVRAARNQQQAGLVLVWIENLCPLLEALGVGEGEQLLELLAGRMRATLRRSDTIARIGDDRFGMILEMLSSPRDNMVVVEKLSKALLQPFEMGARTVGVQPVFGISVYPWDGDEAELLFQRAGLALDRAYENGLNLMFYKAGLERN